jgi:hypothetical protein
MQMKCDIENFVHWSISPVMRKAIFFSKFGRNFSKSQGGISVIPTNPAFDLQSLR